MEPWVQEFEVHSYEVDLKRAASLEVVCRYFLEAAWNHAEALGVGFAALAERGKLWVLSRLLLKVERYPAWGESVRVRTWPRAAKSVFAMRDFELQDAAGKVVASGASGWLILDAATRRPQRLEKFLASMPTLSEKRALETDPDKLPNWTYDGSPARGITIRYSDIDVNSHLNSCRYVGVILDSYSLEFHAQHNPALLEMNYLGETREGDRIEVFKAQSAAWEYQHRIVKSPGGQEACRARIGWRALA